MATTTHRVRWITLLSTLTVVTGLVLVLARANRKLRDDANDLMEQMRFPHAGIYVPEFMAASLRGDTVRIGSLNEPLDSQLLFFFNTVCEFCRASIPAINEIQDRLVGQPGTQVLGIALDSLHIAEMYVHDHGVEYPVVSLLDRRTSELYRIRAVPLLMLVDADGRVAYARRGVLDAPLQVDSVVEAVRLLRSLSESRLADTTSTPLPNP